MKTYVSAVFNRVAEWPPVSFGLLCVSFVNVYQFVMLVISLLVLRVE